MQKLLNCYLKVGMVLNCALGEFNGTYPAIILFTDETDSAYLQRVLQIMHKFAKVAIHGDADARKLLGRNGTILSSADNYLIYSVHETLAFRVWEGQAPKGFFYLN